MSRGVPAPALAAFERAVALCGADAGTTVAVLSETGSRTVLVDLARLAAERAGARVFEVVMPTRPVAAPVPVRSTGASDVLAGIEPVVAALGAVDLVLDCTVEGLLHAPELPAILKAGARVLMISNEHPEVLERLVPDPADEPPVKAAMARLRDAAEMRVASEAGTDLVIDVERAFVGGGWGFTTRPGTVTHWPGGLVACFPRAHAVNGTLVMAPGDLNLTFKRYLESPITLTVEDDHVTRVEGDGLDAALMREYYAAWGDRKAYAVSHVGWGLNPRARWDALTCYDRGDVNGTEQRVFAGNFLYSTGANELAGRHTLGHFDLPLRNCTVTLDGEPVVERGRVVDGAA